MPYKTIALELLRERTELCEQLRLTHMLMPTLETCATELKASHETWKQTLAEAKPDSEPSQLASEALEMAMKELEDRLPSVSPRDEQESAAAKFAVALPNREHPRPVCQTSAATEASARCNRVSDAPEVDRIVLARVTSSGVPWNTNMNFPALIDVSYSKMLFFGMPML